MKARTFAAFISASATLAVSAAFPEPAEAVTEKKVTLTSDATRNFFVYELKSGSATDPMWLFISVHGLTGTGQDFGPEFAKRIEAAGLNALVMGANMGSDGYQFPERNGAGAYMLSAIAQLKKTYKLHDRVFVQGFSAGAQFAHRFCLQNPQLMMGCAPHAAGSWTQPKDGAANFIPFHVSCGMADTDRLAPAMSFAAKLKSLGFTVDTVFPAGLDHAMSPPIYDGAIAVFKRALNNPASALPAPGGTTMADAGTPTSPGKPDAGISPPIAVVDASLPPASVPDAAASPPPTVTAPPATTPPTTAPPTGGGLAGATGTKPIVPDNTPKAGTSGQTPDDGEAKGGGCSISQTAQPKAMWLVVGLSFALFALARRRAKAC